jgi:hypothetical protein
MRIQRKQLRENHSSSQVMKHEFIIQYCFVGILHSYICHYYTTCKGDPVWIIIYDFKLSPCFEYLCILVGISPASDCDLPTFRNLLSVPSSKAGCGVLSGWWRRVIYICTGAGSSHEMLGPMGEGGIRYWVVRVDG